MNQRDPLHARPSGNVRDSRQSTLIAVLVASLALGGVIAFARDDDSKGLATSTSPSTPTTNAAAGTVTGDTTAVTADPNAVAGASGSVAGVVVDSTAATVAVDPTATTVAATTVDTATVSATDLDESTSAAGEGCLMTVDAARYGDANESVGCLQYALTKAGYYAGPINNTFDTATDVAVKAMQTDRDLFVDGIAGRESGISLDIWPAESTEVVHTAAPAAGAMDSMGFPLSSVASTGSNAPPLPENSGSGRRLVYYKAGQRVWAVDDNENIIRSWLVSGSKYGNETPGTHHVYSKSETSTAWNGKAILPHMVRWLKTDIGNIGFHGIPIHKSDGTAYQTEAELGQRLSGGCQRQANRDADFVWAFADIGTTVVVI